MIRFSSIIQVVVFSILLLLVFGCRSTPPSWLDEESRAWDPLESAIDLISLGDEITKRALMTFYPKTRRKVLLAALARYADARAILLDELRIAALPYQRENIKKLLRVVQVREETVILHMPLPPRYPW